jgi:hypothetical protein
MAEREAKDQTIATAAFAVFTVVCLAAFLAFRGSDIGRLPNLLANLGGSPIIGDGIADSLIGILVAAVVGHSWFGLGSLAVRFISSRSSNATLLLDIVVRIAIGAAIWSVIWFLLGLGALEPSSVGRGSGSGTGFLPFIWFYVRIVGLYSGPIAIGAALIGVALGFVAIGSLWKRNRAAMNPEPLWLGENVVLSLIALSIIIAFVASLAPPTAKDTLLYHFALPKAFIAQGGSAFIDGNVASYLALGHEMHFVWSMLLGGLYTPGAAEAAAGLTGFLFFPLMLAALYGWSREMGISRMWSLLATLTVATIPSAYHVASSGYVDISLALFVILAVRSLTRWWKEQTSACATMIGIFLGAALSIKLTSVFFISTFAFITLLRARNAENSGKIIGAGLAALLLAGIIASPWYLRTWAATDSPVFPFYMSIWQGKAAGWDVERSNLFQAMNSQYGGADLNKINYLTAPVRVSVAAQPEEPANYDGVLGPAFLIGLPLMLWALWKLEMPVEVKIALGIAGIMYVFWLFSSQQLRYLLPVVPLLAIGIAASSEAIGGRIKKVSRLALITACVCGLLTSFAWFCQRAPLRVVLGGERRDEYLARNLDYYLYYQTINNETDNTAKVWLVNMRRDTYHLERPYFSDYLFEDWTLKKLVWESRSSEELKSKAAAMNVQYILARHDFLFDYDRSSLVDDAKPKAENEAKLKMARDLLLDPVRTIRADKKFSLVKVF